MTQPPPAPAKTNEAAEPLSGPDTTCRTGAGEFISVHWETALERLERYGRAQTLCRRLALGMFLVHAYACYMLGGQWWSMLPHAGTLLLFWACR